MGDNPLAGLLYLALAAGLVWAWAHGFGQSALGAITDTIAGHPHPAPALPAFPGRGNAASTPAAGGGGGPAPRAQ